MLLHCGAGDSWESLGQQRSNQSIIKKINPKYSLEGLILKLKLQYFGHLRADSLEETEKNLSKNLCWERLKAGGFRDDKEWDGWMASPTQWTWVWARSWRWWMTGKPGVLQSMRLQIARQDWATEQQQQTTLFYCIYVPHPLYPFLCWWTFRLLPCPGYCK